MQKKVNIEEIKQASKLTLNTLERLAKVFDLNELKQLKYGALSAVLQSFVNTMPKPYKEGSEEDELYKLNLEINLYTYIRSY